MRIAVDMTDEPELSREQENCTYAEVLGILFHGDTKLYACTAMADGAPWYFVIVEGSTAFVGECQPAEEATA